MPFLAKDESSQLVFQIARCKWPLQLPPHINFLTKLSKSLPNIKVRRKRRKQLGYFLSGDIFDQCCNSMGLFLTTNMFRRVQQHPDFTFCTKYNCNEIKKATMSSFYSDVSRYKDGLFKVTRTDICLLTAPSGCTSGTDWSNCRTVSETILSPPLATQQRSKTEFKKLGNIYTLLHNRKSVLVLFILVQETLFSRAQHHDTSRQHKRNVKRC